MNITVILTLAGIMSSMYGVGSLIGYFLSSFVLTLWVDFYRLEPGTTLPSPEHPAWVGAWWLGLLICGGFVCIASLPVYGFPRKLPKKTRSQASLERSSTKGGTSAKIGSNMEMKQKGTTTTNLRNFSKCWIQMSRRPWEITIL